MKSSSLFSGGSDPAAAAAAASFFSSTSDGVVSSFRAVPIATQADPMQATAMQAAPMGMMQAASQSWQSLLAIFQRSEPDFDYTVDELTDVTTDEWGSRLTDASSARGLPPYFDRHQLAKCSTELRCCAQEGCPERRIAAGSVVFLQHHGWYHHLACVKADWLVPSVTDSPMIQMHKVEGWNCLTADERQSVRQRIDALWEQHRQAHEQQERAAERYAEQEAAEQATRKKQRRQLEQETAAMRPARGPFHVFSVYYKHGAWGLSTYSSEAEMRQACRDELQQVYLNVDQMDEAQAAQRADGLCHSLSLDDLILHAVQESRRLVENDYGYGWCEVIEGGRQLQVTR